MNDQEKLIDERLVPMCVSLVAKETDGAMSERVELIVLDVLADLLSHLASAPGVQE